MNRLAKAVGAALACALGGAAFALGSLPDISGELDVSGGMLYGTAHEYVLVEEDGSTLSRLDWDEKLVPTVSVAGRARLFDVFASAGVQLAAPFKGGFMEDWDWLGEPERATNYSRHSAFLENDFIASFGLGYTFAFSDWTPLQIPLRLTPLAGFRYRIRKWTASGGYTEYPPGSPQEKLTGAVISYEQTLSSLSAGLEAEYQASRTVALKLRGSVYPYSWAHTLDTHFGRDEDKRTEDPGIKGLQFYDKMGGGIGGSAQLSALYRPFALPGAPAFTCSLSYEHIGRLTGRTASGYIGAGDYELGWSEGYGSQTESSGLSASLGIAWRLGCALPEAQKLSAPREPAKAPVSPPSVSGGGRQPRLQEPAPPPRGYRTLTFRVKGTERPNRTITLNADFVKRDGKDWLLYDTKREDRQFFRLQKHLEWEFGERSVRYENAVIFSGEEVFLSGEEKILITLPDGRVRPGVSQTADSDARLGLCNRVYGEIWELLK